MSSKTDKQVGCKDCFYNLKDAMKDPEKVVKLDLHLKNLITIPEEVYSFPNLEELYLRNNKITAIPPQIKQFKKIKKIRSFWK